MSQRALVVLPVDTDEKLFNVYYSANGAQDLNLTEELESRLGANELTSEALSNVPLVHPPETERWKECSNVKSPDLTGCGISPDPIYSELPLKAIGMIEFDLYEALYLIRENQLETYLPVWLEPDVIRPWQTALTVSVYDNPEMLVDPLRMAELLEERTPRRVIDSETLDADWWEDDLTLGILLSHEAVYALQRMQVRNGYQDAILTLTLGPYTLHIDYWTTEPITPNPAGNGIFIQIPNGDIDEYWEVEMHAADRRLRAGARLREEDSTAKSHSDARQWLLTEILREYHDRVAPMGPFGEVAREVSERLMN